MHIGVYHSVFLIFCNLTDINICRVVNSDFISVHWADLCMQVSERSQLCNLFPHGIMLIVLLCKTKRKCLLFILALHRFLDWGIYVWCDFINFMFIIS